MSGTQKRGFRLPWAAERGPDDGAATATIDLEMLDPTPAAESDNLGAGPFERAEVTPSAKSRDAAPAVSDPPDATAEAAMIKLESSVSEPATGAQAGTNTNGAWPVSDRSGAPEHASDADLPVAPPAIRVEGEARIPRRENPLVAGLVKAMREAALASREETTNRLRAEATARMDAIRAGSTDAAAGLRKRADEDIAGIREWSKAEIARVRQETEDRIESRRVELASETQRYSADIDQLVDEVQTTVAAFEADMDEFFERLLAENDPARLATLAEQAPEPPDLRDQPENGVAWQGVAVEADAPEAVTEPAEAAADAQVEAVLEAPAEIAAEVEAEATANDAPPTDATAPVLEALEADVAAEAEAEATEGLDMATAEPWTGAVTDAVDGGDPPTPDASPAAAGDSRLLVSGLTSVAGISAFKGAVGQLAGVRSVSVTSGERGVFIFSVSHEAGTNIAEAVAGLTGFAVRITEASGDSLSVTAHEPAA